jgi:hypothetical protein
MNTTLYPSELSNLITRINNEIHEQIIERLSTSAGPNYLIGWNRAGEDDRLEIRCETKMVEVRSIVVPFNVIDATTLSIPLSGARLEVVGAWRIDSDHLWLRNHCFGEAGTLVLTLPGFDPEHSNAAAVVLAAQIGRYLDTQLETC